VSGGSLSHCGPGSAAGRFFGPRTDGNYDGDRLVTEGAFAKGDWWRRRNDRAGVAFVAHRIVAAHQQYLALGALGFLLGDGGLTYGAEKILEGFYTPHLWRGFFASCDLQHVNDPVYNKARGPVFVPGLRFHVDF
jgi:high affinity Mn2+ porin